MCLGTYISYAGIQKKSQIDWVNVHRFIRRYTERESHRFPPLTTHLWMYTGNTIGMIVRELLHCRWLCELLHCPMKCLFPFWNIHMNFSRKYIWGHCVNGESVIGRVNGGERVIDRVIWPTKTYVVNYKDRYFAETDVLQVDTLDLASHASRLAIHVSLQCKLIHFTLPHI